MAQTKPALLPQKGVILRANRSIKCSSNTTAAIHSGTAVILNQNPWHHNKNPRLFLNNNVFPSAFSYKSYYFLNALLEGRYED